jgi:photosystem II stability/assembly factor-like uncharacterized protein
VEISKVLCLPKTEAILIAGGSIPADVYAEQAIAIDPGNSSILYLGTWLGLFRSTDSGENWSLVFPELLEEEGNPNICSVAVSPHDSQVVLAGIGNSFENGDGRSTNGADPDPTGVQWRYLWEESSFQDFGWLDPVGWPELNIGFMAISPSDPQILFAGGDHLFRTNDGGETWTEAYASPRGENTWAGRGVELLVTFDVAVDPNQSDRWWVAYDDMGLWRTDDAGQSFVRMDAVQADPVTGGTDGAFSLAVDWENSDVLYVGRNNGENDSLVDWKLGLIYKTTDSGKTWQQLGTGMVEGGRPQLLMLPGGTENSRTLLCALYGVGLFRTTDSGESWEQVQTGLSNFDREHLWTLGGTPGNSQQVYLGVSDTQDAEQPGGVYRSDDAGLTWTKLTGPTAPTGQVLALAVGATGVLYAGTTALYDWLSDEVEVPRLGGLYRSEDQGESWIRVLDQLRVDGIMLPSGHPEIVVCAASSFWNFNSKVNAGTYISRDQGQTFEYASEGLTHTRIWFVISDPHDPDRLLLGTGGGGLFVADLGTIGEDPAPGGIPDTSIKLTFIGFNSDGESSILISGPNDQSIIIQVSEDLKDWSELTDSVLQSGSLEILDNEAPDFPKGFYRALIE